MLTLEKLDSMENKVWKRGIPHEGDWVQNSISRAKIRAMKQKYGKCYLYSYYNYVGEYIKGKTCNFKANFILPEKSEKIENILKNNNMDIFKVVEKINGVFLHWV